MQLVFLCYMGRSGSTFLAKELNQYKDIKVGIEGEYMDGFSRPFPPIDNINDLKNYIESTYENRFSKLIYWSIKKTELIHELDKTGYPVKFKDFLIKALELYFNGISEDDIIIHKAGSYHKYIDKVIKEFGANVKFIFINRDPRSIYNSQKKSLGSESNIPFVNDVETFVKRYKIEQKALELHKSKRELLVIQYEELINNKRKTLKKILHFINSYGILKNEGKNYFENIPEKQKKLHVKLKDNEDKSRIAPWKTELTIKENFLLEKHLKKYFKLYGYTTLKLTPTQTLMYYPAFIYSRLLYAKNQMLLPKLREYPLLYRSYKFLVNQFKK